MLARGAGEDIDRHQDEDRPRRHRAFFDWSVLVGTVDQPLYRGPVEQLHDASLDLDQAFALKAREQPAHGLQRQSQLTADFLARHPQHELA